MLLVNCILLISLVQTSCIFSKKSTLLETSSTADVHDAVNVVIERAAALIDSNRHQEAVNLLRSFGQKEPSYYRMDEVLYLLGRCHLVLGDPVKADRSFVLLRKYYPRAEADFSSLTMWEENTATALAALRKRQGAAVEIAGGNSSANSNHSGPLVSNSFYETDIRQALMDLSAQTNIPIIPDAMVRGYVTMDMFDIPLEQALSLLLSPLGYSYRKAGNYYIVGAPTADNPSFPMLAQTRIIKPKHISAADVPKRLPDYYHQFLKVDPLTNTLTIAAPPDIIARFEEELEAVDHAPQQVVLEALVVEMGDEARRSLGLEWDWTGTRANDTFTISKLLPSFSDTSYLLGQMDRTGDHIDDLTFDLSLALKALAVKNKANIRANPRVSTMDGQEASVRIGREAYYSLLQGSTAYSYVTLEKIATGITLIITPYVGDNADIIADISIEVSDVTGSGGNDLPVTSVRSVETRVHLSNGQTVGIGGLISENKRDERNRIPLLGDIPILGYFFGSTTTTVEETEVVVLITPHLLIDPSEFDQL